MTIYTYETLTPEAMTSLFLYGVDKPPEKYEDRVKPTAQTVTTIQIDAASIMSSGVGSHITPDMFQIVRYFFDTPMAAGSYDQAAMMSELGLNAYDFKQMCKSGSIQQCDVGIGQDDYHDRIYTYGSTSFFMEPSLLSFVVNEDGTKTINGIQILPFNDNFDLSSGNPIVNIGDSVYLQDEIDPFSMGSTVIMEYVNKENVGTVSYTTEQYLSDLGHYNPTVGYMNLVPAAIDVTARMSAEGVYTYISHAAETVDPHASHEERDIVYLPRYENYMTVSEISYVIVGSDVANHIVSGSGNDILFGGAGDDILAGGSGQDVLQGGADRDALIGGQILANAPGALDVSVVHEEWDDGERDYLNGGSGNDTYFIHSKIYGQPEQYGLPNDPSWPRSFSPTAKAEAIEKCDLISASDTDYVAHIQFHTGLAIGGTDGVASFDLTPEMISSYLANPQWTWFANGFADTKWVEAPEGSYGDPVGLTLGGQLVKLYDGSYMMLLSISGYYDGTSYVVGITDIGSNQQSNGSLARAETESSSANATAGSRGIDPASLNGLTYAGTHNNDILVGETTHNEYFAGDGDDTISGNAGTDVAYGGAGSDTFNGDLGDDYAYGGAGNDVLNGGADDDVLSGDEGNDTIVGGDGTDVALYSGADLRYVATLLADGSLYVADSMGTEGIDQLYGIETIRFFQNWSNLDVATMTVSDAKFYGTELDDTLTGTAGRDDILGFGGNDLIDGAAGDDRIYGGAGNDILNGGDGNDLLDGGLGYDTIVGGDGADVAQFYGSSYRYVITYLTDGSLFVTDTAGDNGTDELSGIETLRFYEYMANDVDVGTLDVQGSGIFGTAETEYLAGTSGADVIVAGAGDDNIESGDGDDRLFGGSGNDNLNGGAGDDLIDGGDGDGDWVTYWSSAAGITLNLSTHQATGDGTDTIIGIENVWGSDFNDQLTGSAGSDGLFGADGDDVISGLAGDDNLDGGAGNDTLSGGAGDDHLYGGDGNDSLDGGEGTGDWASYWDANGVTVNLTDGTATGQGTDTISNIENVWGSVGNDSLTGDGQDNELYGSDGNDFIWGVDGYNTMDGGTGDDGIVSGHGNDIIEGGEGVDTVEYWWSTGGVTVNLTAGTAHGDGDDTLSGIENVVGSSFGDTLTGNEFDNQLYGDAGNDALSGLAGNDYLNAGEGDDVLNGGVGLDYLVGGEGADTFRFDPNFGHDTVEDFSLGDVIEFASSVFADFGDVLSAATEVDGSTVIALDGDNSVTLQNVALASLSADEFRFAA